MDHYSSWLTLGSAPKHLQAASSKAPRTMTLANMRGGETACVHVIAFDKLQNASPASMACAGPLSPPPMPDWSVTASAVVANPTALGLVGLDSWFWLAPRPAVKIVVESFNGVDYEITATPISADWDFGDGTGAGFPVSAGYGLAYPQPSSVIHMYQAHSQTGYQVRSVVRYEVSWTVSLDGRKIGPYPLGTIDLNAKALVYPVEQAQPELIQADQDAAQPITP
jgi:hypothetical protein